MRPRKLRLASAPFSPLRPFCQAFEAENLDSATKGACLAALRRLAEDHGALPQRLCIPEAVEDTGGEIIKGGCGEVRRERYKGMNVAVKKTTIKSDKEIARKRKVSVDGIFATTHRGLNHSIPAVLQGGHALGSGIPSEYSEAHRSS